VGRPELSEVFLVEGFKEEDILVNAASLEKSREHPLAEAIVRGVQKKGLKIPDAKNFESVTGMRIVGEVEQGKVLVGNKKLLTLMELNLMSYLSSLKKLKEKARERC
jgi:Cu+-exporting ATPase